jgi:hypothetical protein
MKIGDRGSSEQATGRQASANVNGSPNMRQARLSQPFRKLMSLRVTLNTDSKWTAMSASGGSGGVFGAKS